MKTLLAAFFLILNTSAAYVVSAQEIEGSWHGMIELPNAQKLRIVFHIRSTENGIAAVMESPDQSAGKIPADTARFENLALRIVINALNMRYEGTFYPIGEGMIAGTFSQFSFSAPLKLGREKIELRRPQTPKKPYPYQEEEVVFENRTDSVTLSGTLTLPPGEGPFPAVVLISGSGAQDRDEQLFGHRPFQVLADHLSRNGIAVLRYDDRGFGRSSGNFATATTENFARDAEAAADYLTTRPEIDRSRIGLIGHSEGGIVAPMIAARRPEIAFIVLMAGVGVPFGDLIVEQGRATLKTAGRSESEIEEKAAINRTLVEMASAAHENPAELKSEIENYLVEIYRRLPETLNMDEQKILKMADRNASIFSAPWMQYLLHHDPSATLRKVACPVLALNGEKDTQVDCPTNLTAIREALEQGGNERVAIRPFPNLNHLFQTCTTGAATEYGSIEETIAPEVLDAISEWIRSLAAEKP